MARQLRGITAYKDGNQFPEYRLLNLMTTQVLSSKTLHITVWSVGGKPASAPALHCHCKAALTAAHPGVLNTN